MINKSTLDIILSEYRKAFVTPDPKAKNLTGWQQESFKWKAVAHFQKSWNMDAEDFGAMFKAATEKAALLLTTMNAFPLAMIERFAAADTEATRAMFGELYDETRPVVERVSRFIESSEKIRATYGAERWKSHFQTIKAVSTYLWLRYPDKYYIYRYHDCKNVVSTLESDLTVKKGEAENLPGFFALCDEIADYLAEEKQTVEMVKAALTDACYPDPRNRTLAMDVCLFTSRKYDGKIPPRAGDAPEPPEPPANAPYGKAAFLADVFMTAENYDALAALLLNKKNVILQGAPGVGKTYAARRLAYSIMGEKDESRVEFVQFHQNYSYEDFMMGYKPTDTGFELRYGIFHRFCERAAADPENKYFFIIDEINRGNMSKIFGELLMLIEKDYRDQPAVLAYNGEPFAVPGNLYLIGMMNTADRSLAMIDYALRRRFSFFDMLPGFATEGFKAEQAKVGNPRFDRLVAAVTDLNSAIARDKSLGSGFCIGHSYFLGRPEGDTDAWVKGIVQFDLLPLLREYWFDDADSVQKWTDILNGAVNG